MSLISRFGSFGLDGTNERKPSALPRGLDGAPGGRKSATQAEIGAR